jgi:hypothetical protein
LHQSTNQPEGLIIMIRLATLSLTAILGMGFMADAATAMPADDRPKGTPRVERCDTEEAFNAPCVWDAKHQGNGQGNSSIAIRFIPVIFISHRRAHALTHAIR